LRGLFEPLEFPVDPNLLSILMVKRKDSMTYMEFIRGKYELEDTDYIKKLLQNMTISEQITILTQDFEVLWTSLWMHKHDIHSVEFKHAKEKFDSVRALNIITESPSTFTEPEWGFPKGRRSKGETDVECAMREFTEETNIPSSSYKLDPNCVFTETFVGTNNVKYKHTYFLGTLLSSKNIDTKQSLTYMQKREISAVDWKSIQACIRITRPHYVERKELLKELLLVIKNKKV